MEKKRRGGINLKLMVVLIVCVEIMLAAILTISAFSLKNNYYRMYSEKAQDVVGLIADRVDGDWVDEFSKDYVQDEKYRALKESFDEVMKHFSGVRYLYICKPLSDRFIYLVEGVGENEDMNNISTPGDEYLYVEADYEGIWKDAREKKASDRIILNPDVGYGETIAAWAPIFNSKGEVVAMVEADYVLDDIDPEIRAHVLYILLGQTILSLIFIFLMVWLIRKIIIKPVKKLTKVVDSYENGEMISDMSGFKSNDEISWLAHSFEEMTVRMEKYIKDLTEVTAEKERIGAELNVATQIQADMLPRIFPPFPDRNEFRLFATMDPAKEVGGDFYDFFMIDDDHLGLVMADVSGKGVPAALFMVITKTMIKNRALAGNYSGPGEVLEAVNNQLCEGNDASMFVTVWFGILTVSTGHIAFASAGHEYPAFCRLEEGFRLERDAHGLPLAVMENIKIKETQTDIKPGETLYLYTDGVPEATNKQEELFGEERMVESLRKNATDDMTQLLLNVRKDIDEFVGDAPQFDDITMLGLYYSGKKD
ncbi:MAG: SpoIIE family protein phosphatase [Lachnospiraceae bacterium]|nr:SpoIIE family protein phosphatase [Lachnospiraceae bacterium]